MGGLFYCPAATKTRDKRRPLCPLKTSCRPQVFPRKSVRTAAGYCEPSRPCSTSTSPGTPFTVTSSAASSRHRGIGAAPLLEARRLAGRLCQPFRHPGNRLSPGPQLIQIVRPGLHQATALLHVLCAVIDGPDLVPSRVGKLGLYNIAPKAKLI